MPSQPADKAIRRTIAGLALLMSAGCAMEQPAWVERPQPRGTPPVVTIPEAYRLDADIQDRLARDQAQLKARGLLRTDAGADVADPDQLAVNFLRIALFDEYREIGGQIVARESESRLRRWDQPVRVSLSFGASVPEAAKAQDVATVEALTRRLAMVSGHPVSLRSDDANFDVMVVSEAERRAMGPALRAKIPGLSDAVLRQIIELPPSIYCIVVAFSDVSAPSSYVRAIAIIRAELPDLMRRSCFHEEITQGLGLANDSRLVRPSLFNDDKEFAFLTGQDEQMLRILYDPRLQPGMSLAEAEPIVLQIASELTEPSGPRTVSGPRQIPDGS